MHLALVISLVSILMSTYLFVIKHYRELYKIGISNSQAIFDESSKTMFVKITFVNESSLPFTVVGLMVTQDKFQYHLSDWGEFIHKEIKVIHCNNHNRYEIEDKTSDLPIIIAPYSKEARYFAFKFPRTYRHDFFLEIESPQRFLVVPFNPVPDTCPNVAAERKGRVRVIQVHWRQHRIRSIKDFVVSLSHKKTWFLLKLKIKDKFLRK